MKKVYAMYWSATGTTKKVVSAIAQTLAKLAERPCEIIDFTQPAARESAPCFAEQDIVVFGTPVYAGRVPNVLLKYLQTIQGRGAYAVPVVLFGNRNFDDGLIELRNLLEADGFHTIAGGAFVGDHPFQNAGCGQTGRGGFTGGTGVCTCNLERHAAGCVSYTGAGGRP